MSILIWLLLGALAGWIADKIMGGDKRGLLGDILLGVVGALIGGFVAPLVGLGGVDGFNLYSILVAVGGACLLLWVAGMFQKRGNK